MPIKDPSRYPPHWKQIVAQVRERSWDRCEWCGARNGRPHPRTGSKVVLTTAHLDHVPEHCELTNLAALCQRCHNSYDAPHRLANRRRTLAARLAAGTGDLFQEEG